MFANLKNLILSWFQDKRERNSLIYSFNMSAREMFISGNVPTLLKADISKGCNEYKHQFSHWLYHGLRIKVFAGTPLTRDDVMNIGKTIINDVTLIRRLVVLGFDTLEIYGEQDKYGLRWQIRDFIQLNQ